MDGSAVAYLSAKASNCAIEHSPALARSMRDCGERYTQCSKIWRWAFLPCQDCSHLMYCKKCALFSRLGESDFSHAHRNAVQSLIQTCKSALCVKASHHSIRLYKRRAYKYLQKHSCRKSYCKSCQSASSREIVTKRRGRKVHECNLQNWISRNWALQLHTTVSYGRLVNRAKPPMDFFT